MGSGVRVCDYEISPLIGLALGVGDEEAHSGCECCPEQGKGGLDII